jgi:hypothetical protein
MLDHIILTVSDVERSLSHFAIDVLLFFRQIGDHVLSPGAR